MRKCLKILLKNTTDCEKIPIASAEPILQDILYII